MAKRLAQLYCQLSHRSDVRDDHIRRHPTGCDSSAGGGGGGSGDGGYCWAAAVRAPLPHSAETHMIHPPSRAQLPEGWGLVNGSSNRRYGTFELIPPPVQTPCVVEPAAEQVGRSASRGRLPSGDSIAAMTDTLLREGLVHVPAALSRDAVSELKALFTQLQPDHTSLLDRSSSSPAHLAAVQAAAARNESPPYVDTAIQTLFRRTVGGKYPFLRYLTVQPVCAVAEGALGEGCHVIQHNLCE